MRRLVTMLIVLHSLCLLSSGAGCTHAAVRDNTVDAAGTVADLYYAVVLNNLAAFVDNPYTLPSHIKLERGLVQVSDDVSPQLTLNWPPGARATRTLFVGTHRLALHNWSVIPVQDGEELRRLREWYQWAVTSVADAGPPPPPGSPMAELLDRTRALAPTTRPTSATTQPAHLPSGAWFQTGRSPPRRARYAGRSGGRYVWVTEDHVGGVGKFTLLILDAARIKPEERSASSQQPGITA